MNLSIPKDYVLKPGDLLSQSYYQSTPCYPDGDLPCYIEAPAVVMVVDIDIKREDYYNKTWARVLYNDRIVYISMSFIRTDFDLLESL